MLLFYCFFLYLNFTASFFIFAWLDVFNGFTASVFTASRGSAPRYCFFSLFTCLGVFLFFFFSLSVWLFCWFLSFCRLLIPLFSFLRDQRPVTASFFLFTWLGVFSGFTASAGDSCPACSFILSTRVSYPAFSIIFMST